jgi:deoxyribodipyrimidine photo-lyase
MPVPSDRVRSLNDHPVLPDCDFVLYWMTMARRSRWNFGLQRAVDRSRELRKPLVVLEALRCDYPWASDRLHQFVLAGMQDNAREFARSRALYYPYVEPSRGHGRGLLGALAARACVVVADWYPAYFLPRMLAAAAAQVAVALEAVDSNGLIPLAAQERPYPVARSYRSFVQRTLQDHLGHVPEESPLAGLKGLPKLDAIPEAIASRWPAAGADMLAGGVSRLAELPIDHEVGIVKMRGGMQAASRRLEGFLANQLDRYLADHNHPDDDGTSRLSPYLHFGHLSAHEVFSSVMTHERWTTRKLGPRSGGKREGWWGVSANAENFLDQVVVWRELAFNTCEYVADYKGYASLPEWARRTLQQHAADRRPHQYTFAQLDEAQTGDAVWNASQRQLRTEGWFHSYLRMLWGKKIFEWSPDAETALASMERLMDRYSLDGRDANSYAGFAWVLGRYDRPWPERPVFGTIRYMTSASAQRKLRMKRFLATYS